MNSFWAIARKEFRHVLRDPYALTVATLGTVVVMALVAFAVSADIEDIPIAVMDGDRSHQSRSYLQRYVNDPFFEVRHWAQSHAEALELVRVGQVRGAVVVPAGFERALLDGELVPVQIVADGTEPNIALQIAGNAEALSASFSVELIEDRLDSAMPGEGLASPLEFRVQTLYNPALRELHAFVPGMIGVVLAFPAFYAGLSLVREREQGSLESLFSTPVRTHQLLAGKAVVYLLIGLFDILLVTSFAVLVFGVPFRGSLADLVLLSTLFLTANIGIGMLISTLFHTQMAMLVVGGLVFMLPLTQSGLITPLYAMSADARLQAMIWPATHYILIARSVFLKGAGLQVLAPNGLCLLLAGLVLNGAAVWRFKKRI